MPLVVQSALLARDLSDEKPHPVDSANAKRRTRRTSKKHSSGSHFTGAEVMNLTEMGAGKLSEGMAEVTEGDMAKIDCDNGPAPPR
jgi:hypothetical protein